MMTNEITSHEGKEVPMFPSKRWIFAFMGFLCFILRDAVRISLSVAIVCMVGDPSPIPNPNSNSNSNSYLNGTSVIANSSVANDSNGDDSASSCAGVDSSDGQGTGEFNWDKATQSIVLSSFFYGYLVTQVPGGWLATRFGGKIVLGTSVLIGTIATLLTPMAARWDFKAVAALRIVTGLAQALTTPAMHGMMGRWAPRLERTRISSFIYVGMNVGNIMALTMGGFLCKLDFDDGWPLIFYILGVMGLVWTALWFYFVSDAPDSHPTISKAERDYIVNSIGEVQQKRLKVPWKDIMTSRAMWVCLLAHTCSNWLNYTLLTGLPSFMKEVLKFDTEKNGILSSVPYMVMATTTLGVGQVADLLRKRYLSTTHTRRLMQAVSFVFSTVFIVGVGFVPCQHREWGVVILALALGSEGLSYGGYMVNHVDFAPRYAGLLFGITNCVSSLPGVLSPIAIGQLTIHETQEEWRNVFYLCGGFTLFGAIVFGCFAQGELEPWAVEQEEVTVRSPVHEDKGNPMPEFHNPCFDDVDGTAAGGRGSKES